MEPVQYILVVEDSATQALKLQHVLETEGFETECAFTGEEALDSINHRLPDLIIADYHLPGIQGDELCRQVRMDITTRSLPVLMLTADETQATELHGLESGADDFVAKSEDTEILLLRVHNLLRKSRREASVLEVGRSLFRRARVLIIDDSPTYRQSLAQELTEEGCDVTQVTSGEEALSQLTGQDFDCVMVDMVMPGMDGIAVCQELARRRKEGEAPIVVLMLSAYEHKDNVARALEAGADDFVGKSTEMSVLRARLRALLRRKFLLEQNIKIFEEFRLREMSALKAQAEKEAAEARAALAEGLARANAELEDANLRLRQAEAQSRSARDVAEAASRAKTIFLANMSHELRTPLNAIIGFSELAHSLMDETEIGRYGAYLDNIGESAHHLLKVITDILDVSRVEVGTVTLRESLVTVSSVVESALRLVGPAAAAKGQNLSAQVPEDLPTLRADERLMKQILLNLLSNASKFTPARGNITVQAGIENRQMVISVTDDGVGIAAEDIATVLQPFGQVENAMSPKHEGTGLGLPLAKGFMELHGGSLTVQSAVGAGTTVTLRFPADRTSSC